jgi:hypothetical protein
VARSSHRLEGLRSTGELAAAEQQRLKARELVLRIANSFPAGEPLRDIFLAGPPVAQILRA